MKIRQAEISDLNAMLSIYDGAKKYMAATGNPTQWAHNEMITEEYLVPDIENKLYFLVTDDEDKEILASFKFITTPDPTYIRIDFGQWLNDEPYGTIHSLASSGKGQGIAFFIFDWALEQCPNLRGDTHSDNSIMQAISENYGFKQCGIIYCHNGDPRIAYHVTKDMVNKAK